MEDFVKGNCISLASRGYRWNSDNWSQFLLLFIAQFRRLFTFVVPQNSSHLCLVFFNLRVKDFHSDERNFAAMRCQDSKHVRSGDDLFYLYRCLRMREYDFRCRAYRSSKTRSEWLAKTKMRACTSFFSLRKHVVLCREHRPCIPNEDREYMRNHEMDEARTSWSDNHQP